MEITLFTKNDLMRMDTIRAYELLKKRGYFHVFLSFVDPLTDRLVQDYFCFYPVRQPTYAGGGYIALYNSIVLRIPSDLNWYAARQNILSWDVTKYDVTVLVKGEYVRKTFELTIHTNIRLFDTEAYSVEDTKAA